MLSAWVALGLAAAIEVSVQVESTTPCLEVRRLETLLRAQGLTVREGAQVRVHARGEGSTRLRLEGTRGPERLRRNVPAKQGQCPAVERVVVSLILSWAQPRTWAVPRAEPAEPIALPTPAVVVKQPPRADEPDEPPSPAREMNEPLREADTATEPPAEPAEPVANAPVLAPDAGTPSLPEPPERETPPAVETMASPWSADLSVLGGAAVGPTPDVAPGGTLRIGASWGRFGAVIDAALEAERSKAVAPGTAYLTRPWLGLSGRVHFVPLERLLLDLTLGVRGFRLELGGRGYPDFRSSVLFDFGGALTAGARLRLWGPLWLEGRGLVGLRTRTTPLQLEDLASEERRTILVVAPWDVGLYLGLAARL